MRCNLSDAVQSRIEARSANCYRFQMNSSYPYSIGARITQLANKFAVSPHLQRLLKIIAEIGGHGILVGGCVRDHLLGHRAKDIDIEVYGIDAQTLEKILTENFAVVAVGKTFGIFKVSVVVDDEKQTFDVALPRKENKQGIGHKGFVVTPDPFMTFKEAAQRRDFTINAMGIDVNANELWDAFDGQRDLSNSILKHVSEAFREDPLRVLRAAQFCARFNLNIDEKTVELCKELTEELFTLSKERIFEEFKKLFLAQRPSLGLDVLRKTNALALFPELAATIDCEQDCEWHPEGDVWIHSLMVTDEAAKIVNSVDISEEEKLIVVAGALCHDLGKPATTVEKDGRIKSPGHEQAGVEPTTLFLTSIGFPKKFHDDITSLVKEHLKPHQLYSKRDEVSEGAIRRLAARVNIDRLLMVSQADFRGRTTSEALAGHDPSAPWLKEKVMHLVGPDKTPKPILHGRHLISLGLKPGVNFSAILRAGFDAQLDGEFADEESALAWLKNYLAKITTQK